MRNRRGEIAGSSAEAPTNQYSFFATATGPSPMNDTRATLTELVGDAVVADSGPDQDGPILVPRG